MPKNEHVALLGGGAAVWNAWRAEHGEVPDLSQAALRGLDLSGFDLSRADLRGADLRGTKCANTDLSGARLDGANLSRTPTPSRTRARGSRVTRVTCRASAVLMVNGRCLQQGARLGCDSSRPCRSLRG
jgi:Pentapeptide repeats (8 copies)